MLYISSIFNFDIMIIIRHFNYQYKQFDIDKPINLSKDDIKYVITVIGKVQTCFRKVKIENA